MDERLPLLEHDVLSPVLGSCVGRCELRSGGAEEPVVAQQLHSWVDEVAEVLLVGSVAEQVGQIVKGE